MALAKRSTTPVPTTGSASFPLGLPSVEAAIDAAVSTVMPKERLGGTRSAGAKPNSHLSKEEYWDRKEARDVQRDKDMAWSGLAQAAIQSGLVAQFNMENTEDGLVITVARIVDKLLKVRDSR
jgi:hypothetical protein